MKRLRSEFITINMNESASTLVYDYTTNYTLNMTMDMNHSLEQIKVLLRIFQEDNLVLDEPANTIILAMYCILVTIAGKKNIRNKKCFSRKVVKSLRTQIWRFNFTLFN